MVKLVNKAQVLVAHAALLGGRQAHQLAAHELHPAPAGRIQATQQVQQRAFARARGAHNGQSLAAPHLQVHALEHLHIEWAFVKALGQALGRQHHRLIHSAAPPPG